MASIKVKHRPSTQEGKEGTVYYQVIQNRVIRQIKTDYRIFADEWNEKTATLTFPFISHYNKLKLIKERIDWDIKRLENIIARLDNKRVKYTADDVVSTFCKQADGQSFWNS